MQNTPPSGYMFGMYNFIHTETEKHEIMQDSNYL